MTLFNKFNQIFEQEYVGYRFVGKYITSITNDIEIQEIEESLIKNPYDAVKKHIRKAIEIFANRENPDYDNSIKESISAVESVCQIATKNNKATLGDCLKELEKHKILIPKALELAFTKLYGYTSDNNGIRHANGIGESTSTNEDAKFMLVVCSAFVNYIISKITFIE